MAKGQVPAHAWKPGESGNPAGRPSRRSMRWHANEHFTDEDREATIKKLVKQARNGEGWAIDKLLALLGEGQEQPAARTNILAILAGTDRVLLERLFTALPLGGGDAGGLGGLRIAERGDGEAGVDALEASDVDQ